MRLKRMDALPTCNLKKNIYLVPEIDVPESIYSSSEEESSNSDETDSDYDS